MREKINKVFNNKVLYMVISIVAAFSLWVYVTNVDNQNTETTILGINVNFVGEQVLETKGFVIDDSYNYSVSLRVLGKRDAVLKLKDSNIAINVDVSDINSAGTYEKFYTVSLPSSVRANEVYILKKEPEYVTVRVNQYVSKTIGVKGGFTGTLKEGYETKALSFSPNSVTVGGPENIVSRISYAYVRLSQNDVAGTVNKKLPLVFMDKENNEVPMEKLSVNTKNIDVTMPVIMTKKVPLTVKFNPGGGATESNTKYSIEPKTITLSGDAETLAKLTEISLKTYNLKDIFSDESETCDIPIPSGMINVSGTTKAAVSISVYGLATKELKVTNFKVQNVYVGHKATLATKELSVIIRGEQSALDLITAESITAILDLSELGQSVGKYSLPLKIEIGGASKAGAIGTYTASVIVEAT